MSQQELTKPTAAIDRAWAILFARLVLGLIFFMAGVMKVFQLGPLNHARKYFLPFAGIGPDAQRRGDVIENDRHLRKCLRERRKLRQLRVVEPGIEAQIELAQPGEAPAKMTIGEQTRRRIAAQSAAAIPDRRVANAAKPRWARRPMRLEHGRCLISQS